MAVALVGCPRFPVVVEAPPPATAVDPALYWYYQGRSWVQARQPDGGRVRALVWAGDHQLWVEVPAAALSDDGARLEGYRRAVRDRIVWMECLDARDPGGGTAEAQMQRLRQLTGERLDTPAAWYAWWQANGERLVLARDDRRLLTLDGPPGAGPGLDAVEPPPPAIFSLRIARETPDMLLLAIEYEYGGADAASASLGAITLLDGDSLGHWAYRPAPVFRGRHTAYVSLSLNRDAPPSHATNQVQAEIYVRRQAVVRAVFPLDKEWVKAPPGGPAAAPGR